MLPYHSATGSKFQTRLRLHAYRCQAAMLWRIQLIVHGTGRNQPFHTTHYIKIIEYYVSLCLLHRVWRSTCVKRFSAFTAFQNLLLYTLKKHTEECWFQVNIYFFSLVSSRSQIDTMLSDIEFYKIISGTFLMIALWYLN